MVIAVSDHGNSGISIGNSNTTKGYDTTPVSAYIDPLKKAKMTVEGATGKLKDDLSNIEEAAKLYGLDDLTPAEKEQLKSVKNKKKRLHYSPSCSATEPTSDSQQAVIQVKMSSCIRTVPKSRRGSSITPASLKRWQKQWAST